MTRNNILQIVYKLDTIYAWKTWCCYKVGRGLLQNDFSYNKTWQDVVYKIYNNTKIAKKQVYIMKKWKIINCVWNLYFTVKINRIEIILFTQYSLLQSWAFCYKVFNFVTAFVTAETLDFTGFLALLLQCYKIFLLNIREDFLLT